jgi:hypothetical protein
MTREELKEYCEKKVEICERLATINGEKSSGKIYEGYKLVLELLENEKFMNKPCISSEVCEHDKNEVLDKVKAEIEKLQTYKMFIGEEETYVERDDVLAIIDKYIVESEPNGKDE